MNIHRPPVGCFRWGVVPFRPNTVYFEHCWACRPGAAGPTCHQTESSVTHPNKRQPGLRVGSRPRVLLTWAMRTDCSPQHAPPALLCPPLQQEAEVVRAVPCRGCHQPLEPGGGERAQQGTAGHSRAGLGRARKRGACFRPGSVNGSATWVSTWGARPAWHRHHSAGGIASPKNRNKSEATHAAHAAVLPAVRRGLRILPRHVCAVHQVGIQEGGAGGAATPGLPRP